MDGASRKPSSVKFGSIREISGNFAAIHFRKDELNESLTSAFDLGLV